MTGRGPQRPRVAPRLAGRAALLVALTGLGCVGDMTLPPDVMVSCRGPDDCPQALLCRLGRCTTLHVGGEGEPCADDGRCGEGLVCREGTCRAAAHGPRLAWTRVVAGTENQFAPSVAVDAAGRSYVFGTTGGSADFGAGPVKAVGPTDFFFARYAKDGKLDWVKTFGKVDGSRSEWATSIALSRDGRQVVVSAWGYYDFDFGGGRIGIPVGTAVFVATFDADGTHRWSHAYGSGTGAEASAAVVDDQGEVFLTGRFMGDIDFGTGKLEAGGWGAPFLVRISAAGRARWVRVFGSDESEFAGSLALDREGNPLLAGTIQKQVTIGGTVLVNGGADLFVAKFDRDGQPLWSRHVERTDGTSPAIATTPDGGLVLATSFLGTLAVGPASVAAAGAQDVALVRFDAQGQAKFVKTYAGKAAVTGVAVAADGRVAVTGAVWDALDFGAGAVHSAGDADAFLALVDAAGGPLASWAFGASGDQEGSAVAFDGAGNLVLVGDFEGAINFGAGSVASGGGYDAFVARFEQP